MTEMLERGAASLKEFLYERLGPRVREYELNVIDEARSQLRVFAATLEREVHAQERQLARLLDSEDVRWALREMRARIEGLVSQLQPGRIKLTRLYQFLRTATDLGVGGIRSAGTPVEVADATSRAVDHVHGYLLSYGFVASEPTRPRSFVFVEVRRGGQRVSPAELQSWRVGSYARRTRVLMDESVAGAQERALIA